MEQVKPAKWFVVCAAVGASGLVAPSNVYAGGWLGDTINRGLDAGQDLIDGGQHFVDQGGRELNRAVGVTAFDFNIMNRTNTPVLYSVNGGIAELLSPNYWKNWRGTVQGRPVITLMDNGRGQHVNYGVDSGQRYSFEWSNGVLQVTRDRY